MKNDMKLILASASAARRKILEDAGFSLTVMPTGADESLEFGTPQETVEGLAVHKLDHFIRNGQVQQFHGIPILTADTLVVRSPRLYPYEGSVFGKPAGRAEAERMLRELSGRTHWVYSGFALQMPAAQGRYSGWDCAEVTFFELDGKETAAYLDTGEWSGAAGAYRIQGIGIQLISSIKGSYFTVAGLPFHDFFGIVRRRV